MLSGITFANPGFLYLLTLVPLLAAWYIYRFRRNTASIQVSSTEVFERTPGSIRQYLYHGLIILRLLAIALLIIAFARPQTSLKRQNVSIEGIDIVMALDISSSMLAQDLKPQEYYVV